MAQWVWQLNNTSLRLGTITSTSSFTLRAGRRASAESGKSSAEWKKITTCRMCWDVCKPSSGEDTDASLLFFLNKQLKPNWTSRTTTFLHLHIEALQDFLACKHTHLRMVVLVSLP